ncbi:MAG: TIGR04282 family arsenosugar biosynthesis glycosyltransferase [Chloracidobacterium sp.]|nr:TIGR04282 family arsenosugar biosynthesis glycosyltransferase [Chloracidobacterium sp.]
MNEALIVMAKAPRAGEVKTRLAGALDPEEARDLYVAFLNDTFALMEDVRNERDNLALGICYTPEGEVEAFEEVEREGSLMILQRGENLGERLTNCFVDLFALGFESVVVIGADGPTLPGEHVFDAFECFEADEDVVVGPTEDGGYYLIGMRKLHKRIFEDIPWSSAGVLNTTVERAREAGLNLVLLPEWRDVDTPEDFERLKRELAETRDGANFTRRFLKELAKSRRQNQKFGEP